MKTLNSLTQFLRRWLVTARRSITAPAAALLLFAATCGVTDASKAAGNSIHDTSTAASLGERAGTEAVENGVSEFISWTNFWAVQLADNPDYADNADGEIISSLQTANLLAAKHGLVNMGQIGNLEGYYHFHLSPGRFRNISQHASGSKIIGELPNSYNNVESDEHLRSLHRQLTKSLGGDETVRSVQHQWLFRRYHRNYAPPTDPKWSQQWSLRNIRQTLGPSKLDINVQPAWMQGVTGEGVVVSIVDDGLEVSHTDLSANYDAQASRDLVHHDNDPTPDEYNGDVPDRHGTNCAGIVAMAKSNGKCGVGVAYNAKIGGVKVQLDQMSDLMEASALGYHDNHINVYSSSWGPSDNGFVVSGPGRLAKMALRNGALNGRDGRGVVYVWAAGNGGLNYDSCAADGFSSSIYTVSIGSADEYGRQADFDEECSSKMAVTYSYNSYTYPAASDSWTAYRQVTTTSLNGECKDDFTGTSASAPLAAGVVALTLQANSNLTWRDIQYLVAYTSNPDSLVGGDWNRNAAGLSVSHKFGFGAIDAEAMVTRAKRWINVPQQISEEFQGSVSFGTARRDQPLVITFDVNSNNSNIDYLEHVVVTLSADVRDYSETFDISDYNSLDKSDSERVNAWLEREHPRRGDIEITLTSPRRTTSTLLPFRRHDFVNLEGYSSWPFMSVHYWGENPFGQWTLTVTFNSLEGSVEVNGVKMDLFGTGEVPEAVSDLPAQCHPQCRRGCSGEGPQNCDACRNLRVAATLDCVTSCPPGTAVSDDRYGYCLNASGNRNDYTNYHDNNSETAPSSTVTSENLGVEATVSPQAFVIGGIVAGFVSVILVVVLTVLMCVFGYIGLSKRPFKYRVFADDRTIACNHKEETEAETQSPHNSSNSNSTEQLQSVNVAVAIDHELS